MAPTDAQTQPSGVLIRYGEIGIKSAPVRRQMVERLRQNLLDGLLREGVEGDVESRGPRLWMTGPDADELLRVAVHTFGVVSASPCHLTDADMVAMGALAGQLALQQDWTSFAIRPRREGEHPFSSQDIGAQVGSAVFEAAEAAGRSPQVDLDAPDLELFVEVRDRRAYLYLDVARGPGGLPIGSQGKVVVLLSDRASFLAAWLMMRRGCAVVPVHAGTTGSLPYESVERLAAWGLPQDVEVLPICSGFVAKSTLLATAARLAKEWDADAVATGETLASPAAEAPEDVAVLRPLAGLAPEMIERFLARIGLEEEYVDAVLDETSDETVVSLLSMRRQVTV